jgi:hypothetical protein
MALEAGHGARDVPRRRQSLGSKGMAGSSRIWEKHLIPVATSPGWSWSNIATSDSLKRATVVSRVPVVESWAKSSAGAE